MGRPSVSPLKLESGNLTDEASVMSECFASSFASVYTRMPLDNPAPYQQFDGHCEPLHITEQEVLSILQSLDGNSSMGPDRLHPLMLKICAAELSMLDGP